MDMDSEDESSTSSSKGQRESRWLRLARKRVPALRWLPQYNRRAATADAVAGVTLGLTLVPQAIAYASLAGLPAQYGLYSAFVGTIVYAFFGTVKEVSIGPTSLMALLTLQACRGLPLQYMVLLSFLSGCVVLLMGLLRLGFLVELISPAVTSGFTSATAIIIVAAQLKGLLGLSFEAESLHECVLAVWQRLHQVRRADCALAACCCTALLLLRRVGQLRVGGARTRHALFLLSIGRNALVVASASLLAYCLHDPSDPIFKLSGRVEPGLPPLSLPAFSVVQQQDGRAVTLGFGAMLQELGAAVIMLPIVMVLANIAIAKAFSAGRALDATQEMLTLGLCNVLGSFVHAMPTCGAFTRSAVAHSSGVRSPAAGLYSGFITLVALVFLTPYFYFIPKACLSSVLVCAVMFMVDLAMFGRLWRQSKPELCVLCVTAGVALLVTVELAVLAGVLANVAALLLALATAPLPARRRQVGGQWCVVVRLPHALLYVNASRVTELLARAARREGVAALPMLLDAERLALIDYSATQALERLVKKFEKTPQQIILYNVPSEVAAQLERSEVLAARGLRARGEAAALATLGLALAPATLGLALAPAEKGLAGTESDTLLAIPTPTASAQLETNRKI